MDCHVSLDTTTHELSQPLKNRHCIFLWFGVLLFLIISTTVSIFGYGVSFLSYTSVPLDYLIYAELNNTVYNTSDYK